MGRVDPGNRAEMRSGDGSGIRHTSYVETPALVQLTWDTTQCQSRVQPDYLSCRVNKAWGTVALPLLSRLYVRKKDLPAIDRKHRPAFRTKLELAVELLRWTKPWLDVLNLPI